MAVVTLEIIEGRDQETLDRLHKALAEAVIKELPSDPAKVRTIIHELKPGQYAVGGKSLPPDVLDKA